MLCSYQSIKTLEFEPSIWLEFLPSAYHHKDLYAFRVLIPPGPPNLLLYFTKPCQKFGAIYVTFENMA